MCKQLFVWQYDKQPSAYMCKKKKKENMFVICHAIIHTIANY